MENTRICTTGSFRDELFVALFVAGFIAFLYSQQSLALILFLSFMAYSTTSSHARVMCFAPLKNEKAEPIEDK
jgi:hypothetical protein